MALTHHTAARIVSPIHFMIAIVEMRKRHYTELVFAPIIQPFCPRPLIAHNIRQANLKHTDANTRFNGILLVSSGGEPDDNGTIIY